MPEHYAVVFPVPECARLVFGAASFQTHRSKLVIVSMANIFVRGLLLVLSAEGHDLLLWDTVHGLQGLEPSHLIFLSLHSSHARGDLLW